MYNVKFKKMNTNIPLYERGVGGVSIKKTIHFFEFGTLWTGTN